MTHHQPRLIGINGRLHSGKDSAYAALVSIAAPKMIERVGFADKLKLSGVRALGAETDSVDEAVELANLIKETCVVQVVAKAPGRISEIMVEISGREFWQYYGTESHRDVFGQDFWVDALLPPEHPPGLFHSDVVVVTDVRFTNEAQRILDMGGEVWWIDAEQRLGPLPEGAHVSEQPLPAEYLTGTVDNNGSLEQFSLNLKEAYYG